MTRQETEPRREAGIPKERSEHPGWWVPRLCRAGAMTSFGLPVVLVLVWAYILGSTVAALRFARRPIVTPSERPAVSVLKPLHGAEPGLYDNLRSFLDQAHPESQRV